MTGVRSGDCGSISLWRVFSSHLPQRDEVIMCVGEGFSVAIFFAHLNFVKTFRSWRAVRRGRNELWKQHCFCGVRWLLLAECNRWNVNFYTVIRFIFYPLMSWSTSLISWAGRNSMLAHVNSCSFAYTLRSMTDSLLSCLDGLVSHYWPRCFHCSPCMSMCCLTYGLAGWWWWWMMDWWPVHGSVLPSIECIMEYA